MYGRGRKNGHRKESTYWFLVLFIKGFAHKPAYQIRNWLTFLTTALIC